MEARLNPRPIPSHPQQHVLLPLLSFRRCCCFASHQPVISTSSTPLAHIATPRLNPGASQLLVDSAAAYYASPLTSPGLISAAQIPCPIPRSFSVCPKWHSPARRLSALLSSAIQQHSFLVCFPPFNNWSDSDCARTLPYVQSQSFFHSQSGRPCTALYQAPASQQLRVSAFCFTGRHPFQSCN